MKTNIIMNRPMGNFNVEQRTSDGYFDGNALLKQWKNCNKNNHDTVSDFLSQKKVQDFMSCLEKDLGNEAQPHIWDMANFNIQKPMEEFLHTDYQQLTNKY